MSGLRVVSLNTWKCDGDYHRRMKAAAAGLEQLHADVILLQECFAAPDFALDSADFLARALLMHCTALPLRAKPRLLDGHRMNSVSGLAILSKTRPARSRAVMLESDSADGERAALAAIVPVGGRDAAFASVHLTHLPGRDDLRRRQLQQTADALADCPDFVVGGDFNAPIDDFPLDDLGLTDARLHCGRQPAATLIGAGPESCIDHMLCARSGRLQPIAWRICLDRPDPGFSVAASDHAAIVVDFQAARPAD